MLSYINLGLRIFFGSVAGVLKLLPMIILSSFKRNTGRRQLEYNPDSVELGASLFQYTDNKSARDNTYFIDAIITTKDGTKLHAVIDAGQRRKKGKRPIVFVHGFPELWISWIDQMEYFAKLGHPILALNMRGYGKSDKPTGIENYHLYNHLVKDIQAAVEYATNELVGEKNDDMKPLLVAHDWGASICWSYACQKQTIDDNILAGYVSLTIPPPKAFEENLTLRQVWASLYMIFFNMPWLPEKFFLRNSAAMIGAIMDDTNRVKPPEFMINAYRANVLQEGAMEAQLNYYRSVVQKSPKPGKNDYGTRENRFPLPALIIRGLDDVALKSDIFRNLDLYLEHFKLVELDNCSHWIQTDCPEDVNREIEAFLQDLSTA